MTVLPVVTTKRQFGDDTLSITLRNVSGEPSTIQAELVIKTVSLWQYLKKLIDAGERTTPLNKTPEMAVQEATMQHDETSQSGYSFEPWQETRVTVFDSSNHYGLTVHSDTMAQSALDTYYGLHDALEQLAPKATETTPASAQTRESAPAPMVTPEAPKQPLTDGIAKVNGKKAAKELTPNTPFLMPIAKIAAVMSPEGLLKWELFGFYGSNPGKFSDLVVFSDNENSIRNGLNAALTAIVSKPGQSVTGKWLARGKVTEKEGKKGIYANLLFTEGGELLNQKPQKEKSDKFDERDYYAGAYADDWNEFEDMPL